MGNRREVTMAPVCLSCPARTTLLILSFVCNFRVASAQDAEGGPHVRSEDPQLSNAIRQGLEQSSTFRNLVERLDRLPGIVHVVSSRCGTRLWEPEACLDHRIVVRGGFRFLRVNIYPGESGAKRLALIAHELQHALEVLSDYTITTSEDVERLFEAIGTKRRSGSFETQAALRVQESVYREAQESLRFAKNALKPLQPLHRQSLQQYRAGTAGAGVTQKPCEPTTTLLTGDVSSRAETLRSYEPGCRAAGRPP